MKVDVNMVVNLRCIRKLSQLYGYIQINLMLFANDELVFIQHSAVLIFRRCYPRNCQEEPESHGHTVESADVQTEWQIRDLPNVTGLLRAGFLCGLIEYVVAGCWLYC